MLHEQRLKQAQAGRALLVPTAQKGALRPTYHYMPPAGWINDPNGLVYFQGQHHLFYQHNPYAPKWASVHWGHAVSADLIHWNELPIALAPSELYDDDVLGGCFSGSAAEKDGKLFVFYTGSVMCDGAYRQAQCLAVSTDGVTFEKYANNPVVASPPPGLSCDFRDPKVFCHDGMWYMVVGGSVGGAQTGDGCALLYKSETLYDWNYCGAIARSDGKLGTMWECPDLFLLDGKWVLLFSPMAMGECKTVYLVGSMDFDAFVFTPEKSGRIDWGFDFYAPQTFADGSGRRIMIGWQDNWEHVADTHPAAAEGWRGFFAIPRVLSLDSHNRLISQPVAELETLCGAPQRQEQIRIGETPWQIDCPDPIHFALEIAVDLTATTAQTLVLALRKTEEQVTKITVDFAAKQLTFDRTNADGYTQGIRTMPLLMENSVWVLNILSDRCSLEIFTDGGRSCMSCNVFHVRPGQSCTVRSVGGETAISRLTMQEITAVRQSE